MKNKFNIILIAALTCCSLFQYSCKDDYLTKEPRGLPQDRFYYRSRVLKRCLLALIVRYKVLDVLEATLVPTGHTVAVLLMKPTKVHRLEVTDQLQCRGTFRMFTIECLYGRTLERLLQRCCPC